MTENSKPSARALDTLVAERIMGWISCTCADLGFKTAELFRPNTRIEEFGWRRCGAEIPLGEHAGAMVPAYSTDLAAAFTVQAEMQRRGYAMDLHSPSGSMPEWRAYFYKSGERHSDACRSTAALAIVLAALRAVGVPESEIQAALAPEEGAEK